MAELNGKIRGAVTVGEEDDSEKTSTEACLSNLIKENN